MRAGGAGSVGPGSGVSTRARDVVPLSIGSYLVLYGLILLLDAHGVITIGIAGAIGSAFGLAFVGLGVLAVTAAWRVRRVSRRLRRAIGHVRSSSAGWSVEDDSVISTVFGDIWLDLRHAHLADGETELTVLCWVGTIQVRVPADVGLDVTAQAMFGSVDVLGRQEVGLVRDVHVRTDGYARSARRIRLHLSTVGGEIFVAQST